MNSQMKFRCKAFMIIFIVKAAFALFHLFLINNPICKQMRYDTFQNRDQGQFASSCRRSYE